MIDYDDLRKKAHAANQESDSIWFSIAELKEDEFSNSSSRHIAAMSPDVTLRLLDIIAVAKDALIGLRQNYYAGAGSALDEIVKLEKE